MITAENLTTAQIVALKQELGRAALDGAWSSAQEALNTACNVAMASTFDSSDRDEARQLIADYLNAKSGEVTAAAPIEVQVQQVQHITAQVTARTAGDLIPELRETRPELIHFAGAAHRDPMALEVCREYQLDPEASEDDLRARARATVYGGDR